MTTAERPAAPAPPRISYLVHDTSHADIARRVDMLDTGGARTVLFGFRRRAEPDPRFAGRVVDLGQTKDARLVHRILAVARALIRMRNWATQVRSSDIIIARNLEMLVLAAAARRRYARQAALVYECLDIHRLMSAGGVAGAALRGIEGWLLGSCQGLMVSSPGFIREHFRKRYPRLPPVLLVENKVFATLGVPERVSQGAVTGPPWRIGWYGVLRCRRSLDILSQVLQSAPGLLEVVVAGRAAPDVFGEDGALFQGRPGLRFLGPFSDEAALAELFRSVHFTWAVDYFETGGNSDWLLPNRLYRALLYGSVPIARKDVETGRWLDDRRVGILLEEPLADALLATLRAMTNERLAAEAAAVAAVPSAALVTDAQECRELVSSLRALNDRAGRNVDVDMRLGR